MALKDYANIIHRCFRCGWCKFPSDFYDFNCPAYSRYRLETYSTGGRLWLIRAWMNNEIAWTDHLAQIVYSCAACKNCAEQCVMEFKGEIVDMITAARNEMVERGTIPSVVKEFLENIQRQGNPYGSARAKRSEWLEGTKIERYQGQEFLYYVGCVGSYDTRAREIARTLGEVMHKAGVSFGVLGEEENCEGNEVYILGEQSFFEMLAEENIQQLKHLGVKKIVTLDPHAYNAFKNYYPKHGGEFEVLHYTQVLRDLVKDKKLNVARGGGAKVTYHDPCLLGRWNQEYDAPREILNAIPGIELVEMVRSRENALCCGGGGGNFYTDFLGGSEDSPARVRIREAKDTGASIVAAACPNCMSMLEDAVKAEGLAEKLKVRDISEIVSEAIK